MIDADGHMAKDNVNSPSHYKTGKYECIDVMVEAMGIEVAKGFCLGNAFKYLYRQKRKNGIEDIRKARWYLDKYLGLSEKNADKQAPDSWDKLKEMGLLTNVADDGTEHYQLGDYNSMSGRSPF